MSTTTTTIQDSAGTLDQPLFTCLSCSIAFPSAEDQRLHYRSDHHRYNMKRRVAGLPPVSVIVFNQKVLDRKTETAVMASARGSVCEVCSKTYTTENAYRSHLNSKKHKENELKAISNPRAQPETQQRTEETQESEPAPTQTDPEEPVPSTSAIQDLPAASELKPAPAPAPAPAPTLTVDAEADEDEVAQTIDQKIAAARSRLSPTNCLFCPATAPTIAENLAHMSTSHSFFIPDADYLVDLPGLLTYLGEKIAVGNVCIYCNTRSREFRTLDAVRKHMLDKGHCKIGYDEEQDRLEISDFYDFSSSYPDAEARAARRAARQARREARAAAAEAKKTEEDGGEWEEVEDDGSADEVVEESASEPSDSEPEDLSDSDELPEDQLTYGDSHLELVLPSGARIGHRSMRRYYAQSFPGARTRNGKPEDPNSGAALVRQLLADKNSALVPRKGGFGAFGQGTDVVKARNRGEAREAGRHVREFRDQARKEQYKTRVAYVHNNQKHYRDPLLQ